jgi:hypothetical protein
MSVNDRLVTINGETKRWEDLSPEEKAEVRQALDRARATLANAHIDRDRILREVRSATSQIRLDDIQRSVAEAQANTAVAMRSLDTSAPYLRDSDRAQIQAAVRRSLESVQRIDMEKIRRELAAIDPRAVAASVAAAEQSMRAAREELDRMDSRLGKDRD